MTVPCTWWILCICYVYVVWREVERGGKMLGVSLRRGCNRWYRCFTPQLLSPCLSSRTPVGHSFCCAEDFYLSHGTQLCFAARELFPAQRSLLNWRLDTTCNLRPLTSSESTFHQWETGSSGTKPQSPLSISSETTVKCVVQFPRWSPSRTEPKWSTVLLKHTLLRFFLSCLFKVNK